MRRRSSESSTEDVDDNSAPQAANANLTSFPDGARGKFKSNDSAKWQTTLKTATYNKHIIQELDRRKSTDKRPATARRRRPSNTNWEPREARNGSVERH